MKLTLIRVAQSQLGTFGILRIGQIPFATTLEKPWGDNAEDISCIPPGVYRCVRVHSPRFGETFEVTNVPDRTHILFHKGNTTAHTKGCILVGERFDGSLEHPSIGDSKRGFDELMALTQDHFDFELEIV